MRCSKYSALGGCSDGTRAGNGASRTPAMVACVPDSCSQPVGSRKNANENTSRTASCRHVWMVRSSDRERKVAITSICLRVTALRAPIPRFVIRSGEVSALAARIRLLAICSPGHDQDPKPGAAPLGGPSPGIGRVDREHRPDDPDGVERIGLADTAPAAHVSTSLADRRTPTALKNSRDVVGSSNSSPYLGTPLDCGEVTASTREMSISGRHRCSGM